MQPLIPFWCYTKRGPLFWYVGTFNATDAAGAIAMCRITFGMTRPLIARTTPIPDAPYL